MNNLPEITALFTQLAKHLQTTPPSTNPQPSLLPSVSSLNQSLNLNEEQSNVRVLNKALSLMCFKAPEVFDNEIKYLVDTIVSVLSSSVSCEVSRFQNEEFLKIGSFVSSANCAKLVQTFLDVANKMEEHDELKKMLLSAVLRVAVSTSCYENLFPFAAILSLEPRYMKSISGSEFHHLLREAISVNNHEIPLRLLLWYLDPQTLRNDISNVLREFADRPFIDLKRELRDRMAWHSIIICLVLSPIMFIETRILLHNWFLTTGLASILELQMRLVSSVLDVLAQPMRWSLSMEVGSKLPFLDAYFPNDHELVAMLVGPISGKSFLGLLHHIKESISLAKKSRHLTFRESTQTRLIGHKSTWAKVMAFPEWFIFASVLLFFSKKGCQSLFWETCMETEQTNHEEHYCAAAAKYLAYSISPMSEAHSDILVKYLIQISKAWTLGRLNSSTQQGIFGGSKNLRKSELRDIKKTNTIKNNDDQVLRALLEEFHNCHMKYWTEMSDNYITKGGKAQSTRTPKQHLLFRKIPLGILIGYSNLNQGGCELLLHYATTGEILESAGAVQIKHDVQKSNRTEEALEGVLVVLDLCGTVEDMSCSMFETEEKRLDFVCQLKIKMVGFMVKCTRKLLQVNIDEDCCKMSTLMDLQRRLEEWIDPGAELMESFKPIKQVLVALRSKIHLP